MQVEIDHLLKYIQDSGCTFIRNGKEHDPEATVQHIMEKYNYFKNKIESTERFIDLCAAKSTMSNKPYKISCPGEPLVESKAWLLQELYKFRKRNDE
ncbi:MAG: DUF5329 family protein [Deltaproteobacteria bacterium]|nr:DUF5329 family protein [Deltaproteobacteria bacterium]